MDIGNLSSLSDMYVSKANAATSKLESGLKSDYSQATDEELMDACKQFEAYFVEKMFKEMVKTIPKSESASASTNTLMDYMKDEMLKEVSGEVSEQGNLGLAQMLYEQMKRNYGTSADSIS